MKNKKSLIFGVGITVAMVAGFMLGQFAFDKQQEDATPIRALVPNTPRKLAMPALQQGDGSRFDMASLQGKWSLLFFGYTNCPDVCPTTLSTVTQAKQAYTQQHAGEIFPQVVFISVDPGRDTPEILGKYVSYFDKDFIGATGEEKLLTAITVQMNSTFVTTPSENKMQYQVGHSLNLILINPDVELVAVLRAPHSVKSILDALQYFKENKPE